MKHPGTLFLIPAPISDEIPLKALPPETIDAVRSIRNFVVESERTAGRILSGILDKDSLAACTFSVLDEHTSREDVPPLLRRALEGEDTGLISEAGCPCVADPGSELVAEAHRKGIRVAPLSGPSSLLLALMASGFNGQSFLFLGYIPARNDARRDALLRIERDCLRDGITRIFIETPYRNRAVLEDALRVLDSGTLLCVAASLGSAGQKIRSAPVSSWRETAFDLGKEPAVFLLSPGAPAPVPALRKNHRPVSRGVRPSRPDPGRKSRSKNAERPGRGGA